MYQNVKTRALPPGYNRAVERPRCHHTLICESERQVIFSILSVHHSCIYVFAPVHIHLCIFCSCMHMCVHKCRHTHLYVCLRMCRCLCEEKLIWSGCDHTGASCCSRWQQFAAVTGAFVPCIRIWVDVILCHTSAITTILYCSTKPCHYNFYVYVSSWTHSHSDLHPQSYTAATMLDSKLSLLTFTMTLQPND